MAADRVDTGIQEMRQRQTYVGLYDASVGLLFGALGARTMGPEGFLPARINPENYSIGLRQPEPERFIPTQIHLS